MVGELKKKQPNNKEKPQYKRKRGGKWIGLGFGDTPVKIKLTANRKWLVVVDAIFFFQMIFDLPPFDG